MIPLGGISRDAALRQPGRQRSTLVRIRWSLLRDRAVGPKSLLHGGRTRSSSPSRPPR